MEFFLLKKKHWMFKLMAYTQRSPDYTAFQPIEIWLSLNTISCRTREPERPLDRVLSDRDLTAHLFTSVLS